MSDHESSGVLRDRSTRRLPLRGRARSRRSARATSSSTSRPSALRVATPSTGWEGIWPGCPTWSATSAPARWPRSERTSRGFAVGDRAVTVGLDGSHAARRATPEGFAWKIPDGGLHRRRGLRAGSLRHGRRLPLRVRPPAGGRDGPHPCRRRRGRHRRHPDGQAGRGARLLHGVERRPARTVEGAGTGRGHQLRHARLRRRGASPDRRAGRGRGGGLGRRRHAAGEHQRPGLPGPLRDASGTPAGRRRSSSTSRPCAATTRRSRATSSVRSSCCRPVRTP